MHRGRIISDGVLAGEEEPRWVFDHVVAFSRISRNDGSGQDVVVVAGSPDRDEGVGTSGPWICSPPVDKNANILDLHKIIPPN